MSLRHRRQQLKLRTGAPAARPLAARAAVVASDMASGAAMAVPEPQSSVFPHDPQLLERARTQWQFGDWKALADLDNDSLQHHPDRARLVLLAAAGHYHLGHAAAVRMLVRKAREWGSSERALTQLLVAGVHDTLGRAELLCGRDERSQQHFRASVAVLGMGAEPRLLSKVRSEAAQQQIEQQRQRQRRLPEPSLKLPLPDWIVDLVDDCAAAPDLHEAVDDALAARLFVPKDRFLFLCALSDVMRSRGDAITAQHFLNEARPQLPELDAASRTQLARRLIALGRAADALELHLQSNVAGDGAAAFSERERAALMAAYRRARDLETVKSEHGHEVLLHYLSEHLGRMRPPGRTPLLIEVGTTRENVAGQGSTAKIAEFCKAQKLAFVTVDMDPHNTRAAQQMLDAMNAGFKALAMKGEDYLRDFDGPLDFVFLDAYDFDHGKHSELRQSRYERYLGSRIDDEACHRMHLDCARSVAAKLAPQGLVCIDDTWLDDGAWTAKGTLAMPYLLQHGFELIEARNRAALLRRRTAAPASGGTA